MTKLGIADVCICRYSDEMEKWFDEFDVVAFCVKELTDELIDFFLSHKENTVLCVSCSGYGGTILEKNICDYITQLRQVKKLISKGFPNNRVIIDIDPVIPTAKGIMHINNIVSFISPDIKTFRIKVFEQPPYMENRFRRNGLPTLYAFQRKAPRSALSVVDALLKGLKEKYGVQFVAESGSGLAEVVEWNEVSGLGLGDVLKSCTKQHIQKTPFGLCLKFNIDDSLGGSCGIAHRCSSCEQHDFFGCDKQCVNCNKNIPA